jgi:tRNA uridine 5-carboxymethylaminomethyl modification enzyme
VIEGEVADLQVSPTGRVTGVVLADDRVISAGATVLTTGTFLGGLIHLGEKSWPAGRHGEAPAQKLADRLRAMNLPMAGLRPGRRHAWMVARLPGIGWKNSLVMKSLCPSRL